MKILLIDDDMFLRDMYATKFIECGHDVHTAENGHDVLRLLEQQHDFDVALVDMIMPGMIGTELITKIKEQFPNLAMKIIMLSNQGQDEDIAEAKDAGAIGYIIKAKSIPSEVVKEVESIMKAQA
jgi:two-component system, OmpR family, response regulator VicR